MNKKEEREIKYEEIGLIYHYCLRSQSFDISIQELIDSKLEYKKKGYFDFTLWFQSEEDNHYICIKAKRYENDEEYKSRLKRIEERQQTKLKDEKIKIQEEKKLYKELKKKYEE